MLARSSVLPRGGVLAAAFLALAAGLLVPADPVRAARGTGGEAPSVAADAAELEEIKKAGVQEIITRAVAALGGRDGGRVAWERVSTVDFRYRREARQSYAEQKVVAAHRYRREADGVLSLEVGILEGEGKGSLTTIAADQAWIEVDGARQALPPDQARRHLAQYAPEKLFHIPLEMGPSQGRVADGEILDALRIVGLETVNARKAVVLAAEEDGVERLRMLLDTQDWRLLEATFESAAGRITYRFGDYRAVAPSLVLPFHWEFWRNDIRLDLIEIQDLQVALAPPRVAPAPGTAGR